MQKEKSLAQLSLSKMIGPKWRVTYEESWQHEKKEEREPNKIDYEIVKIRGGGHFKLHDAKTKIFKVWTQRYKVAIDLAREFPEILIDKMDGEAEIFFPISLVDTVLERMHGARKKVMSEEWKQQARERMHKLHAEGRASSGRKKKSG